MTESRFNTVEELYAIVIGVLGKEEGKIVLTKFNKIIKELGLDKVNSSEFVDIVDTVRENEYLNSLKNSALSGELGLGDLRSVDDRKVFTGNDYFKTVSTYVTENERTLSQQREFRKYAKQGAHINILMEDLKKSIIRDLQPMNTLLESQFYNYVNTEKEKSMVVLLSDFHIGALTSDYTTGGYDFNILKCRLNQFLETVIEDIESKDITDVTVYFVGDLVEHISMRDVNQAFETEFTLAEQISKGTRLIIDILNNIRQYVPGKLTFGIIGGNHDRMQGNKNQKVYNDNVAFVVLDMLLMLKQQGVLKDIELIDNREDIYNIRDTILGKKIVVNHGDGLKGKGNHIPKFITDSHIDLLITGHVHHHRITQEDYNRFHIVASSPMGYNNYAKELHLSKTKPSQQILVLEEGTKNIDIKTVFLD